MTQHNIDPNSPAVLTILTCAQEGKRACKVVRPDRLKPDPYDAGTTFTHFPTTARNVAELYAVLHFLDTARTSTVVRGVPRADAPEVIYRHYAPKWNKNGTRHLESAPQRWVAIDLDKVPVPPGLLAYDAMLTAMRSVKLPEFFFGASLVLQASTKMDLPGGSFSGHIWGLTDRAVTDLEWKALLDGTDRKKVDRSLFSPTQIHYTARPRYEGVTDPLSVRVFYFEGARDRLIVPAIVVPSRISAPIVIEETDAPAKSTRDQAITLLVKHWPAEGEGKRHHTSLALSGAVARCGWSFEDAVDFHVRVLEAAGASEGRSEEFVSDSIERLESGDTVWGWTKLGEMLGADVVARVRLLIDPPADAAHRDCKDAELPDLKALLPKWKRRDAFALRNLISGARIVDVDKLDTVVKPLVEEIIRAAPQLKSKSLAELFTPSFGAMEMPYDASTAYKAKIVEWCERARQKAVEAAARAHTEQRLRPIVQTADSKIYFQNGERYEGPIDRGLLWEHMHQRYPAEIANARIVIRDFEGKKLPDGVIIERYAKLVNDVKYEIGRREDAVEGETLVLGCANRTAEPRFVKEVDDFLRAFCPNDKVFEDFQTWAVVAKTMSTETLAALQVIGPAGVGKNLFADANASTYHDGPPTTAQEAFGQFNIRLKDCPLVFCDEGLPVPKYGSEPFSQRFRTEISKKSLDVEEKGQTRKTVKGALRMLFAANKAESLTFHEDFAGEDISAIAERIYRFHVSPERMDSFARRIDPNDPDSAREWGDLPEKVIAGMLPHVMYLAHTKKIEKKGRFWIKGDPSEITSDLQIKGGTRDLVMQWVVAWLFEPCRLGATIPSCVAADWAKADETARKRATAGDSTRAEAVATVWAADDWEAGGGHLWLASSDIADHWGAYIPAGKAAPSVRSIGQALRVMSHKEARPASDEGPRHRYFDFDISLMTTWCENSRRATREELFTILRDRAVETQAMRARARV